GLLRVNSDGYLCSTRKSFHHLSRLRLLGRKAEQQPFTMFSRIVRAVERVAVKDHEPTILPRQQEFVALYNASYTNPCTGTTSSGPLSQRPRQFRKAEDPSDGVKFHSTGYYRRPVVDESRR